MWIKKNIKIFRKRNRKASELSGTSDKKLLVWNCGYSETDIPTNKIVAELNVKDGRLIISGRGNMMNYCLNGNIDMESPWHNYKCHIKTVVISKGVKSIGDFAFAGCELLISIDMSKGIARIGNGAFMKCKSLTSVDVPKSITSIGNMAFSYCKDLSSVNIPNAASIGSGAFNGCSIFVSKNISTGVKHIDGWTWGYDECLCYTGGAK
jgi:hypothetical protein